MGTAFILDKNTSLTLAGGSGTPTFALAGSARVTGSISITENGPERTRVKAADGQVKADVATADPEFWGTVTVAIQVNGGDLANNSGAELHHIARALLKQDLSLIPGTAWTAAYAYDQGGGCDANVDLSIAVTYCNSGSDVTKTLSLGAVTVTDPPSMSIGEAVTEYSVTFQLIEEPDWTTWA